MGQSFEGGRSLKNDRCVIYFGKSVAPWHPPPATLYKALEAGYFDEKGVWHPPIATV